MRASLTNKLYKNMRNKSLFTLLLSLSLVVFITDKASAQEVDREIGLRMSSLNNFNFVYKKAKEENKCLGLRAGAPMQILPLLSIQMTFLH